MEPRTALAARPRPYADVWSGLVRGDGAIASLRLTLYIAGAATGRSMAAKRRLHDLAERLAGDVTIDVVDVLEEPERAEQHAIFATPTLVRESPAPGQRVIGDLSEIDEVARLLGLDAALHLQGAAE